MFSKRLITLFFSLVFALSSTVGIAAQEDQVRELMETLNAADESYMQVHVDREAMYATPTAEQSLPRQISNAVLVGESEEEAADILEQFRALLEIDSRYTLTEIDDLGDEAFEIRTDGADYTSSGVIVRAGNVFIVSASDHWPEDATVSEEIVRYMLEHGPSDEPFEVAEDGQTRGGWTDAFPQEGDIPDLEGFPHAPVQEFTIPDPGVGPEISTPTS